MTLNLDDSPRARVHEGRRYSRHVEQIAFRGVRFEDSPQASRPEPMLHGLPPAIHSYGISSIYQTGPGDRLGDEKDLTVSDYIDSLRDKPMKKTFRWTL